MIHFSNVSQTENLWHRSLGHPNFNTTKKMIQAKELKIDEKPNQIDCEDCVKGKQTMKSFPKESHFKSKLKLELVHSDVCGPLPLSKGGSRYFITFTDDYTKKVWVYTLKSKSDAFQSFKNFKVEAENQSGNKIKILRTDNGGEYTSKEFNNFCQEHGIIHQTTIPYSPQQNGVSERLNRTLVEKVRTMLSQSQLEKDFWGEALATAVYLKNRTLTKLSEQIPEEMWRNSKVSLNHLRVFGSKAFFKINLYEGKLESKSKKGILVGYSETQKGYRVWCDQKIHIVRNVKFDERSSN